MYFKICRLKWKTKKLKGRWTFINLHSTRSRSFNGILFIDYLSKLKKDMIIKKLVKHKKGN